MDLSVVVPTLNGRDRLEGCLDALATHAPDAEVVVVNGPSTDGTTGMVRDREDVDVLVEVADRNLNVCRNAGIAAAGGDVVALVGHDLAVEESWPAAVTSAIAEGADAVTGPTRRSMRVGTATEREETTRLGGRDVTFFNGDNVAFTQETLRVIDGFDESLETGGARDGSHRLAGLDRTVTWRGEMCVRREVETDGGTTDRDWGEKYRSFGYRLAKSYGLRPSVVRRIATHAASDAAAGARAVAGGEAEPSVWVGGVRDATVGLAVGTKDGLLARLRDRRPSRNPRGLSARFDRAVETYEWR